MARQKQSRQSKRTTIIDVARKLGVSPTTVSLVIQKHPRISKATAKRVTKCIEELGYQPDLRARGLVTGKSNLVGMIVPDSSNPFFADIFRGAEDAARLLDLHLLLNNGSYDLALEEERIRDLLNLGLAGIIACPAFRNNKCADKGLWLDLKKREVPVVLLNRSIHPQAFDQVAIDYIDGVRQGVEHLVAYGHRRIAVVRPDVDILPVKQRMAAMQKQFRRHGLPWGKSIVAGGTISPAGGYEATRSIWDDSMEKPTAVFCLTDPMATGALKFFIDRGVRVPGQVSLIGMDSTPIADFRARPVTSLDASLYEMGRLAVEMLSERIAGRDAGVPANESLPMQLKDRGSTAAVSR